MRETLAEEIDQKHQLGAALAKTQEMLPLATRQRCGGDGAVWWKVGIIKYLAVNSVFAGLLTALRRRGLSAAEVVRHHASKMEHSGAQTRLKQLLGARGKK